jgi:hypothetical protein
MAHVLQFFGDDDSTVLFEVGTDPAHANPYLQEPGEFAPAEVDLLEGRASIGFGSFRIVDAQTGATQQDRWLTARLGAPSGHSALIRRRLRWLEGGAVRLDGIVAGISLNDSFAGFTVQAADIRDRGVDVPAFTKTTTCSVLPRGVVGGFGRIFDGAALLVAPALPLRATFRALTTESYAWGQFSLDGAPQHDGASFSEAGLLHTPAMEELARPATTGTGGDRFARGVHRHLLLRWRPVGGTTWTDLRDLPAYLTGLFASRPGKLGGRDVTAVAALRFRLDGSLPVPANMQRVELQLVYEGPPTTAYPLHVEKPFGQFAVDIMAGTYSDVNPRLRYDAAAWLADTTPMVARITSTMRDVRTALEELCRQRGCAPGMDESGLIVPVYDRLPPQEQVLPQVDDSNSAAAPGWDHPASQAVTAVEVTYRRFYYEYPEADPDGTLSGGDSLSQRDIIVRHVADPAVTAVMGEQDVLQIDAWALGAFGGIGGQAITGDVTNEAGAQLADQRARSCLDRFSYGAQSAHVRIRRDEFPGLKLGAWVIDARPWAPNYLTGKRGGGALAQVVSLQPVDAAWLDARLIYAGPADMPMSTPTFGGATIDAEGVVTVTLTAVPAIGSLPSIDVDVEYAVAPSMPGANSGAWVHMGRVRRAHLLTMPRTIRSPAMPAGAIVWLRGRASAAGVRPSAWVNIGSVEAAQAPRFGSFAADARPDGSVAVRWTPNAYALGVRLAYASHGGPAAPELATYVDVAAAAGEYILPASANTRAYFSVRGTPYNGWTGSAVTGTPGQPVDLTLARTPRRALSPDERFVFTELNTADEFIGTVSRWGALVEAVAVYAREVDEDEGDEDDAIATVDDLHSVLTREQASFALDYPAADRVVWGWLQAVTVGGGEGEVKRFKVTPRPTERPSVMLRELPSGSASTASIAVRVTDTAGEPGTLHLWSAPAGDVDGDPTGTPDASIYIASVPASLGPDEWAALAGIKKPLASAKTIFAQYVTRDDRASEVASLTLKSLRSRLEELGAEQLAVSAPNWAEWADANGLAGIPNLDSFTQFVGPPRLNQRAVIGGVLYVYTGTGPYPAPSGGWAVDYDTPMIGYAPALSAGIISVDYLDAGVGEFVYLTAQAASIDEFEARVATIENAYITEADIETLLVSGDATFSGNVVLDNGNGIALKLTQDGYADAGAIAPVMGGDGPGLSLSGGSLVARASMFLGTHIDGIDINKQFVVDADTDFISIGGFAARQITTVADGTVTVLAL